jgi:hypothetical protein
VCIQTFWIKKSMAFFCERRKFIQFKWWKTAVLAVKVSFVRAAGVLAKGRMFDMPAIQNVISNVQTVPRQSPDIYWHAELCSRRPCSVYHGPHSECVLWWPSSTPQLGGDCFACFLYCNHHMHRGVLITLYYFKAILILILILSVVTSNHKIFLIICGISGLSVET